MLYAKEVKACTVRYVKKYFCFVYILYEIVYFILRVHFVCEIIKTSRKGPIRVRGLMGWWVGDCKIKCVLPLVQVVQLQNTIFFFPKWIIPLPQLLNCMHLFHCFTIIDITTFNLIIELCVVWRAKQRDGS